MSESTKNTVAVSDVLALAEEKGLVVRTQKAFYRIEKNEDARKAVYVSRTKRGLTRADYAGFVPPKHSAIKVLTEQDAKELKLGAVRGQTIVKELRVGPKAILNALSLAMDCLTDGVEGFKLGKAKVEETPKWEPYPALFLRTARGL